MRITESPQTVQLSKDGIARPGSVEWRFTDDYRWAVSIECADFTSVEAIADDAFEALCRVREQLEPHGWRVGVTGAQLGVWPSGMARDQGGGKVAYRQQDGQVGDRIDTFEPVDPATVTTVAEQQADVERQHGTRMRATPRTTHVESRNASRLSLQDAPPTVEALRATLGSMDGSSRWAYSLWRAPADPDLKAGIAGSDEYMQCTGTAAAMTVEVRFVDADGTARQYAIGRAGSEGEAVTEVFRWNDDRHETMLRPGELLTADEAAELFAAYGMTDRVAEQYVLRELDLRSPAPSDDDADEPEMIVVELWREDAHPGDLGERTDTVEVPARMPLSAVLTRVIEPFLAQAPRTGWVCRGTSRGAMRDFSEVVTYGSPDRLGVDLLVRDHSIREFVGAEESTFRVACRAPLPSGGSGRAGHASKRALVFSDGDDLEQRWEPDDATSAPAAFWAFVREHQPEGSVTFGIEDEEHDEGLILWLGSDAIVRVKAEPTRIEFRAVPVFGEYLSMVSTFVSGGFSALDRYGPWLPDQQELQAARLQATADESLLRRTHPRELRRRLHVLTQIGGREPAIVDGVTHYGFAHRDGSSVDAWFADDGRGLLTINDRTSPLHASALDALTAAESGVPAAVLAAAEGASATGAFTFAAPCSLADGSVSALQAAELELSATGVERLIDPFLELEPFTPEMVAATEWWSAEEVRRGFAAAAAMRPGDVADLRDPARDDASIGVLRRAWATTGFFDRWGVHWVLFDSCTLEEAGEARDDVLRAIEALGLERVDAPAGSTDGEVWVRTDPRIGLTAGGGVDAGSAGDVADMPLPDATSEAQTCAVCDTALVRSEGTPPYDIDIDATTAALQERVATGRMREVVGDVPLADMIDLFAADMKYTIVTFLECLECTRLLEWGLAIRGAAIFRHVEPAVLERMRWSEVPSRLAWQGAASFATMDADERARERKAGIARHLAAMAAARADATVEVVEVSAGSWMLLESGDDLLFATRRSGSREENSLLLRLDATETADYRRDGATFLDDLATSIHGDRSPIDAFDARDLYRGRGGPRYRAMAADALRAWKLRQPRPGACEVCTSYWVTYAEGPITLGESERLMGEVRRCRHCGAYWEVGAFSYPRVISRERVLWALPELPSLEARLGIAFPEPPPLPPDTAG